MFTGSAPDRGGESVDLKHDEVRLSCFCGGSELPLPLAWVRGERSSLSRLGRGNSLGCSQFSKSGPHPPHSGSAAASPASGRGEPSFAERSIQPKLISH